MRHKRRQVSQDGVLIRDLDTMLRLGHHVRLTRREVERFTRITGMEPAQVRTLADLEAYIAQCKAHYWGVSRETQFLHWLIDREYQQCRGTAVSQQQIASAR